MVADKAGPPSPDVPETPVVPANLYILLSEKST
jgi:hypothetical protein